METGTHVSGVTGSQNEPFYDLLHPNNNGNNSSSGSGGLIKQMDELGLGFEKDIVLPSYNSQILKTSIGPSSSGSIDLHDNSPRRPSQSTPTPSYSLKVHSASEYHEPSPAKWEYDRERFEVATMEAVERTMKRQGDNLLRAMEGINGKLTQLENKTQYLENSVEELKISVGKSHGEADGRMRLLENLLREVQAGVQILRDKQEIAEARSQIEIIKAQSLKNDFSDNTASHQASDSKPVDPQHQTGFAAPRQPVPSFVFPSQPETSISAPTQNIPGPLLPQQSGSLPLFPTAQTQQSGPVQAHAPPLGPQQVLPSTPSIPSEPSYQNSLHQSSAPPPPPLPQQYQVPPHMQQGPPNAMQISAYSQNPQPQQPSGQPISIPFSQPEPTPSLAQHMPHSQMPTPALPGNYGPEPPYMPSNYGGSSSHQPPRSMPPPQLPASQRFSGSQQGYEPTFGRTSSGPLPFPPTYGPGFSGPPAYGDSQTYSGPSFRLPQQDSNPSGGGSSAGHPRLPTAKPLQHSLPVASSVNSSPSGSTSSSNRVPVDDVVDKVSSMGFPRDQVKMVVQKLTENGQSVDLNVVLDKLMNGGGGEIQPQKGWFGR